MTAERTAAIRRVRGRADHPALAQREVAAAGSGAAAPEMLTAVEATAGEPGRPVRIGAEYLLVSAWSADDR